MPSVRGAPSPAEWGRGSDAVHLSSPRPVWAGPRLTATRKPRTCKSVRTRADTHAPVSRAPGRRMAARRPSGDKRLVSRPPAPEGPGTQGCRSPAWLPVPCFLRLAPPVLFYQWITLSAVSVLAGRSDHGFCDVLSV